MKKSNRNYATTSLNPQDSIAFKLFGINMTAISLMVTAAGEFTYSPETRDYPEENDFEIDSDSIELEEFELEIPILKRFFGQSLHDDICVKLVEFNLIKKEVHGIVEELAGEWEYHYPEGLGEDERY